ncbi:hypothetical protein PR202_ga22113 [Eleusine coracana subsp. coracana]|uniref:DUF3444 domain-containing protein n=1 Tax=Eleusine coracana subsp. coracana TaxID=191504 RepID=A0AAV5D1Q7_ELECO|nr:hypothetical protein PR202_ga22113 [Eleusine coracana subsp. coracana]
MKRSLYDIKRKHASREVSNNVTRLLGKTHEIKNDVTKRTPPYDSIVVFWTICPHCQKRFVYYQQNLLVSCDDCGKNFFAFKLHEQSMPTRFQSAASNHSRIQAEMFSCQLHGASNQQALHTKLHATGEDMDSEWIMHAVHTDGHIRCDRRSCGDSEVSCLEARSQFSAVIQPHSPSPSSVKNTIGSTPPDSADPNFVTTQNLRILDKRKQDGGINSISGIDSCGSKRQRDASPSNAELCSDNVVVAGNPSTKHLPSKVDSNEEGNAGLGGNQQSYKKETTDICGKMYVNPEITYDCPDFFDFGKLRDINGIAVDQIWAIYDDHDFMPRVYARINHIDASNLKVWLSWLDHNTMNRQETKQTREELPVAFGNFCLGDEFVLQDPSMYLSHRVSWTIGKNMNSFEIYPKKGEIWALYKESSMLQISVTDKYQSCNYDVVQVSNVSMGTDIIVSPLVRIEGFVSLFARAKDKSHIFIRSSEMHRFSHSIPCYRTNGNEKQGLAKGFLGLDTAALPCDLATAFPSIDMNTFNKKRDSELVVVTYPNSEFHNFDEDRSCEVWAIYKARSSKNRRAEYAVGEIIKRTEASLTFAFLTKVEGHASLFKPDVPKVVLEIPMEAKLRFSHRIPSFRLTSENGGKLQGFYELDPAAVPDAFLRKDVATNTAFDA